MTLEQIIDNLPNNMPLSDKDQYIKTYKRIIEIEETGYNRQELEFLRNYAFRIITPYVLDANYKG